MKQEQNQLKSTLWSGITVCIVMFLQMWVDKKIYRSKREKLHIFIFKWGRKIERDVVLLHPKPLTAWPRTSSPGRTWWCCWCPVHKRSQTPNKGTKRRHSQLQQFPTHPQATVCWKDIESKCNTSKRRWSASSNGFPSSLFSTWATPVTQSQFIHTMRT